MTLKEFKQWLEPLSNDYEIKIYSYKNNKERSFDVLKDIDLNHRKKLLIIDGEYQGQND